MHTGARGAFRESITLPVDRIAAELQRKLGQRAVAYAAGIKSPKLVGRWADKEGGHSPRPEHEKRLRALMYVVRVLQQDGYGDETVRAFIAGDNPDLGDKTPLDVIRAGHGSDAVRAATAFVGDQIVDPPDTARAARQRSPAESVT